MTRKKWPWATLIAIGCGGRVAPQKVVVSDGGPFVPPANYVAVQNTYCSIGLGPVDSCAPESDDGGFAYGINYCGGVAPFCVYLKLGAWGCCDHSADDGTCPGGYGHCNFKGPPQGPCNCLCPACTTGPGP